MTTVAYRDGILAADSRMTQGMTSVGSMVKIVRNPAGDLAGAAGTAHYSHCFKKWFLDGEPEGIPEPHTYDDCMDQGFIIRKDGLITVFEPEGWYDFTSPVFAIGSGRNFALGAMHAGADAIRAVAAAIEFDGGSGGDILALSHSENYQALFSFEGEFVQQL